jgi:WD40 repeat protein
VTYDAFISYSHSEQRVARWIHRNLGRIGRRPTQRRALNNFLDSTDLSASPNLWESVRTALDASRNLVVVLSPAAAQSTWVRREIQHWLETKSAASVVLAVAGGTVTWDPGLGAFSATSDAVPEELRVPGVFDDEPLFVDLRDLATEGDRSAAMREKLVTLAAAVHGVPRTQLADDDRREVNRAKRLRRLAVVGLVLLTVTSSVAAVVAVRQRQEARDQAEQARKDRATAIQQRNQAVATSLAAASSDAVDDNAALALALAVESYAADPDTTGSLSALVQARVAYGGATLQPFTSSVPGDGQSALALSSDGRIVAADNGDNGLGLWDTRSGQSLADLELGRSSPLAAAFSPDDSSIAVGNYDRLRVYRGVDDFVDLTPFKNDVVLDVAFSQTLPFLAVCDNRGVVLYDTDQDYRLTQKLQRLSSSGDCFIAFNPAGDRLAAVVGDVVYVWKLAGAQLARLVPGFPIAQQHLGVVSDVAFGQGGDVFVGGDAIRRYERNGLHSRWSIPPPESLYRPIAVTAGGAVLVTGDDSPDLRVYSTDKQQEIQRVVADPFEISAIVVSQDGSTMASGGEGSSVHTFDVETAGRAGVRTFGSDPDGVSGLAMGSDGVLATAGIKGLRFWSATGQQIDADPMGSTKNVSGVSYSDDGSRFAAYDGKTLRVWDTSGQALIAQIPFKNDLEGQPAFSPDGRLVAQGEYRGRVHVWDVDTGEQVADLSTGTTLPNFDTLFVDDDTVAASFSGGLLVVWDLDNPDPVFSEYVTGGVTALAYNRATHLFAIGSDDGAVVLYDERTNEPTDTVLTGHSGAIYSIAFSPDGALLVTGGADETARLWDVATGRELGVLEHLHSSGGVEQVAFSDDGTTVVAAAEDVRVWPRFTSIDGLCPEVVPFVTGGMLAPYLPEGWDTHCSYGTD